MWPDNVDKTQLEITWFNGTGKGGQNRNKNANCCRMKHIPTGIMSQAQEHKSREQNKKAAFRRLAEQLVPLMKIEIKKKRFAAGFDRIRTYHEKRDEVIDERVPDKKFSYTSVLDGNLDQIHKNIK
jgi:protein subunit release factor A